MDVTGTVVCVKTTPPSGVRIPHDACKTGTRERSVRQGTTNLGFCAAPTAGWRAKNHASVCTSNTCALQIILYKASSCTDIEATWLNGKDSLVPVTNKPSLTVHGQHETQSNVANKTNNTPFAPHLFFFFCSACKAKHCRQDYKTAKGQ